MKINFRLKLNLIKRGLSYKQVMSSTILNESNKGGLINPRIKEDFKQSILKKYQYALETNKLFYYPSTDSYINKDKLIQYQIRLVPALKKKLEKGESHISKEEPTELTDSKIISKNNPFLPCDPDLLISDELYPNHNLVLNKFCVVPGHILLTTKSYESQDEPLSLDDFMVLLDAMFQHGISNTLGFYNCGKNSGASQPHKHMQLIPLNEYEPPIYHSFNKLMKELPFDQVLEIDNIPYSHRVVKLSSPVSQLNPVTAHRYYKTMLEQLEKEKTCHHNLTLFKNYIYLLPRKKDNFQINDEQFSINALGSVHMIMAKDQDQADLLINTFRNGTNNWAGNLVGFNKP